MASIDDVLWIIELVLAIKNSDRVKKCDRVERVAWCKLVQINAIISLANLLLKFKFTPKEKWTFNR